MGAFIGEGRIKSSLDSGAHGHCESDCTREDKEYFLNAVPPFLFSLIIYTDCCPAFF